MAATQAKFVPADQIDETFKSKYTGMPLLFNNPHHSLHM